MNRLQKSMQFNKSQKSRDVHSDQLSNSSSSDTQNHSIILNCYQQKKVSLLIEETLLTDKSFYINFNIDQLPNHKTYVMYITSYRIYLMCTVDSEIVTIPHAYVREYTCFDNEIRFVMKTGVRCFLVPVEAEQTEEIYAGLVQGQKGIPFSLQVKFNDQQPEVYDCLAQMERMLINWKKVSAIDNKNGKEIATYPKIIFVPAKIDKEVVKQNQKSRHNARIPALTYYLHPSEVYLWRCGHPLKQQHNKYDFTYLESISPNLLIIEIQQLQNRRQSIYSFNHFSNQIKYSIYKFEGLSQVRCNYERVVGAYVKEDLGVFWKVMGKWFEEVDALVRCAWKAAEQLVKMKRPVLVQENDLWKNQGTSSTAFSKGGVDRACQICALIQVIIDPYYRSMKGLSVLIEKEFVSFGYPFKERCGFQQKKQSPDSPRKIQEDLTLSIMSSIYRDSKPQKTQISPTFIQFLDCLSQLINCFPAYFEYSSEYLAQIGYELYSAKYNNFLFNTIHEKHSFKDIKHTQPLYQHIGDRKALYNLQFCPQKSQKNLINVRDMPNVKEYLVWKEYWDMITKMNCAEKKSQDSLETAIFRKQVKQRAAKIRKKS